MLFLLTSLKLISHKTEDINSSINMNFYARLKIKKSNCMWFFTCSCHFAMQTGNQSPISKDVDKPMSCLGKCSM